MIFRDSASMEICTLVILPTRIELSWLPVVGYRLGFVVDRSIVSGF